jgi:hypothetical protein
MMNSREFKNFEMEIARKESPDINERFRIVEALYGEAVALGTLPLKDPLEGLEVDIRIAKVINHDPKTSKHARKGPVG